MNVSDKPDYEPRKRLFITPASDARIRKLMKGRGVTYTEAVNHLICFPTMDNTNEKSDSI